MAKRKPKRKPPKVGRDIIVGLTELVETLKAGVPAGGKLKLRVRRVKRDEWLHTC